MPQLMALSAERFAYGGLVEPTSLAPPGARIKLWRIAEQPRILFVHWVRDNDPRNRKDSAIGAAGVVIWREESFAAGGRRWRSVYQRRYGPWAHLDVTHADVTGDRIPEVAHSWRMGSAGCGAYRVVMVSGRRAREIFRRRTCESYFRLYRGVVMVNEPVGPCPDAGVLHCSGGRRVVRFRWSGTRLVPVAVRVKCTPGLNLDPARECRRRR